MKPGEWDVSSRVSPPKGEWGDGAWLNEPDKAQWLDAATGYPCLVARGPSGALCGYVGIPPEHPAWGLSHHGTPSEEFEERMKRFRARIREWGKQPFATRSLGTIPWGDAEPDDPQPGIGDGVAALRVHGGLTYANKDDRAAPPGASWPSFALEPGDPDYWLFGFDCAHAGDYCPGFEAQTRRLYSPAEWARHQKICGMGARTGWGTTIEYRSIDYVRGECEELALQLRLLSRTDLPAFSPKAGAEPKDGQ